MSSKPLIANEVLAFINHAIDYMDEVSIVQICRSAYKEDEVCSAKLLLYKSLGQLEQMPSRRRDGGDKSLQDIISLLKRTDPDDVPEFVAKDLHKLPPVTFHHVDVTRLLKDITCLKASLEDMKSKMEASQVTISDLRGEVALLRNAVSISGSLDIINVNTRRGAQNASVISFESANSSASPIADVADDAPRPAAAAAAVSTPAAETCVGTLTPKRTYAAVAATNKPVVTQTKRANAKGGKQTRGTSQPQTGPKKDMCDKDGFIKVERRKKRPPCRNQCGTAQTGPNILLRPAVPTTQLYVSRLHHTTTVEQIVEYVRSKTNWTLRVAKLESRHNTNFNSFMVRVPTHHIETFLKEEFWPKGVVYRRFRGWLRDTSLRNTTPTLRVH
ncbi:uncharacterized protein LOC124638065 [Helicoverpa zea]|uniref:uncharacterized protein LOC124638065 n=1 Tax=Helicoverpa zea TaxID=7113 RepID=UPI001F55F025|nr:uncharacterized protein LOC124638065 [Helicoverpa zea]